MKQIIILNGPPRSGKDTLAEHLRKTAPSVIHGKFADELKTITHRFYDVPNQEPNAYEDVKDIPTEDFLGYSPRQAYINISQYFIKIFHSEDFFGMKLAETIKNYEKCFGEDYGVVYVISDGGFAEECKPLIETFGADKISIIQIHRDGCNFKNDSRSYFQLENVKTTLLKNDKIDHYLEEGLCLFSKLTTKIC